MEIDVGDPKPFSLLGRSIGRNGRKALGDTRGLSIDDVGQGRGTIRTYGLRLQTMLEDDSTVLCELEFLYTVGS